MGGHSHQRLSPSDKMSASKDWEVEFVVFFEAAERGDAETVKKALAERPEWGARPKGAIFKTTALMIAAANGRDECVKALLPASNPKALNEDGFNALMLAAGEGCLECVRILAPLSDLEEFADTGETALDMALEGEHWACADILAAGMSPQHAQDAIDEAAADAPMERCRALLEGEEIASAVEAAGEEMSGAAAESASGEEPDEEDGARQKTTARPPRRM